MSAVQVIAGGLVVCAVIAVATYAKLAWRLDRFELALFKLTNLASQAVAEEALRGQHPYRESARESETPTVKKQESLAPPCPICKSCETVYVPCHGQPIGKIRSWCLHKGLDHAHVRCATCLAVHAFGAAGHPEGVKP